MKFTINLDRDNDRSKVFLLVPPRDLCGLTYTVQTIGYEQLGPKYYLERSEWDSIMITYVKKGRGSLYYEDKYYNLEEGSLIVINCMTRQVMMSQGPEKFEIIFAHIHSPTIVSFCSYINTLAGHVISNKDDQLNIEQPLLDIINSIDEKTYYQGKYQDEIYQMLMRIVHHVETNTEKYQNEPKYIENAKRYISQNYMHKISLQEIAEAVSITPNHLESYFKKYTKFSIGEYIANLRLQAAQRELLISDKSIAQIASEVGLSDSQALIRLFKRKIGVTPLHYRIEKNRKYT